LGGFAFFEEEQIGGDCGMGRKTLLGLIMVCRWQVFSSFWRILCFTHLSGKASIRGTIRLCLPCLSSDHQDQKESALSMVRKLWGKFFSLPSARFPKRADCQNYVTLSFRVTVMADQRIGSDVWHFDIVQNQVC
jgi:hypothetical protein